MYQRMDAAYLTSMAGGTRKALNAPTSKSTGKTEQTDPSTKCTTGGNKWDPTQTTNNSRRGGRLHSTSANYTSSVQCCPVLDRRSQNESHHSLILSTQVCTGLHSIRGDLCSSIALHSIPQLGNGTGLGNPCGSWVRVPKASGKVSVLFSCLSGLFKDKKGKKGKKGQRHTVLWKPSRFTIKVTFYFERQ
jgi:hypothetical protein